MERVVQARLHSKGLTRRLLSVLSINDRSAG